jgi:hypothetical protein
MPGTPNVKRFYLGQPGTSATTLYTAPANTANQPAPYATAEVKSITLANTTANAATITIGINGTAAANQVIPAISINGNDVKVLDGLNWALNANDTLQALQGTSGAITVTISGIEIQ